MQDSKSLKYKVKHDYNQKVSDYIMFYNDFAKLSHLNSNAENQFFIDLSLRSDCDKLVSLILDLSFKPSVKYLPIIFAVKSKNSLNHLVRFLKIIDDTEVLYNFINITDSNNNNTLLLHKTRVYTTNSSMKNEMDFLSELLRFGINPLHKNNSGKTYRHILHESRNNNTSLNEIIKIAELLYHETDRFISSQSDEDRDLQQKIKFYNLSLHDRILFIILQFGIGQTSYLQNQILHDKENTIRIFLNFVDPEFGTIFHRLKNDDHANTLIVFFGKENFKKYINHQNPFNGNTPLHDVCKLLYFNEQYKLFTILFENGADLKIKNYLQKEPELLEHCSKTNTIFEKLKTLFTKYRENLTPVIATPALAYPASANPELLHIDSFEISSASIPNSILSDLGSFPCFGEDLLNLNQYSFAKYSKFPSAFFTNQDYLFDDDWFEKSLKASIEFNLGCDKHLKISLGKRNDEESIEEIYEEIIEDIYKELIKEIEEEIEEEIDHEKTATSFFISSEDQPKTIDLTLENSPNLNCDLALSGQDISSAKPSILEEEITDVITSTLPDSPSNGSCTRLISGSQEISRFGINNSQFKRL